RLGIRGLAGLLNRPIANLDPHDSGISGGKQHFPGRALSPKRPPPGPLSRGGLPPGPPGAPPRIGHTQGGRPPATMQGEQEPSAPVVESASSVNELPVERRQAKRVVDPSALRVEDEGDGQVRRPVEPQSKRRPGPDARLAGEDVTDALDRRPTERGGRV